MSRTVLGHTVLRTEDRALLTGAARYVDDVAVVTGAAWAVFVRSVYAHAELRRVDTAAAQGAPGVLAVCVAADLDLPLAPAMGGDGKMDRPRLATGRVRFVGEPIAVVVAQTRAQAYDAADLVVVDADPLPPVVDPLAAVEPETPLLFPEFGANQTTGPVPAASGDGWPAAEVVVRTRLRHRRIAPAPMEPNGAVAVPEGDRLTVYASTQSVFGVRGEIARALGVDESAVTVRAPAVGGGFGAKGGVYNEQVVVAALARRLGRAVAWTETRAENLVNMTHARAQVHDVEIGAKRDGTIVGLRVRTVADVGAYPIRGAFIPMVTRFMASGCYRIPAIEALAVIVVTNTTPTGPYRGAGRPEAAAMCERSVNVLAGALGLDPIEVRRRNFVAADAFPYRTATGATYDTGDYHAALGEAVRVSRYDEWRAEQVDAPDARRPPATGDRPRELRRSQRPRR